MAELVEQATNMPTRKVTAAGVAGAIVTLVTLGLNMGGVEVNETMAALIAALAMFAAGYIFKERAPEA